MRLTPCINVASLIERRFCYRPDCETKMEIGETLIANTPAEFRQWLEANHRAKKEIWLVIYKKASGPSTGPGQTPGIRYNEAIEEALCFGWSDSTMKSIDAEKSAQRFS